MARFVAMILIIIILTTMVGCEFSNEPYEDNAESDKELLKMQRDETSEKIELIKDDFESYESIITMYRNIVEFCINYQDEKTENGDYASMFDIPDGMPLNWYNSIFSSTYLLYPRSSDGLCKDGYKYFGYTIKDLNDDNVEELILRLSDDTVIAIFTMVDNVPALVDCYWNRYSCWIDSDGLLHIHGSSGAAQSSNMICEINNVGKIVVLWECGTNGYNEDTFETIYYKVIGGEKYYITKDEYDDFGDKCPYLRFDDSSKHPEYLIFMPLFDGNYIPQYIMDEAKG